MTTPATSPRKFYFFVLSAVIMALAIWQLLFYNNEHIQPVLVDIHIIYLSTLLSFLLIKLYVKNIYLDLVKIFVRTLFRVWLLILITLTIARSMDRVGVLLSLTFIFGYFEGLLDLDKWIQQQHPLQKMQAMPIGHSKFNHALTSLLFMSVIHICCAVVLLVFARVFM